jgi:hypothetical protein
LRALARFDELTKGHLSSVAHWADFGGFHGLILHQTYAPEKPFVISGLVMAQNS